MILLFQQQLSVFKITFDSQYHNNITIIITFVAIIIICKSQNRVVGQNPNERNYHIFYCLLAGISDEYKGEYQKFNHTLY